MSATSRPTPAKPVAKIWPLAVGLEPPIGIEPMTYALRGGCRVSTVVQRIASTLLAGVTRSTCVQGHPASLLADPLARPASHASRCEGSDLCEPGYGERWPGYRSACCHAVVGTQVEDVAHNQQYLYDKLNTWLTRQARHRQTTLRERPGQSALAPAPARPGVRMMPDSNRVVPSETAHRIGTEAEHRLRLSLSLLLQAR